MPQADIDWNRILLALQERATWYRERRDNAIKMFEDYSAASVADNYADALDEAIRHIEIELEKQR